jgi:hypothetical protein
MRSTAFLLQNLRLPYGTGNSQEFCGFLVKIVFLPTIPIALPPAIRTALKSDVSAKKAPEFGS